MRKKRQEPTVLAAFTGQQIFDALKNQYPETVGKLPDGRYTMRFQNTVLIIIEDQS